MRRSLAIALLLAAVTGLALLSSPARAEQEAREPRLVLPGGRVVWPGEWIELRWDDAGEIRELEILLSRDGGRTYSFCLSPPLPPGRRGFRWRVPASEQGVLHLRIRFNRDGREIEAAPAAPLVVASGTESVPLPLHLPPVDDAGARREPPRPAATPGNAEGDTAAGDPRERPPAKSRGSDAAAVVSAAAPSHRSGCGRFHAPRMRPLRV